MGDTPQPESWPDGFGFDPSQVMRFLRSEGPVNWDVARQVAEWVAGGGQNESTIDPADTRHFLELARAAETSVVAETGLAATFAAEIRAISPQAWARVHLDSLGPVLEALATTLARDGFGLGKPDETTELPGPEQLAALGNLGDLTSLGEGLDEAQLSGLLSALAPTLLGVQAGSMIGHLSRHSFGRYDLPLPVGDEPRLLFVVPNIDAFESDWSLPRDDLRFSVALHEVVHAATRSVPWVRERLVALATEYVSGYRIDPDELERSLDMSSVDPSDPSTLAAAVGDPQALLGAMQTEEQRVVLERLQAFTSVLEGYADIVIEQVGRPLIPSFGQIDEAMRRHRIERGEAERFIERLLGLELRREHYEQGEAFCRGVIERAGLEGLNRLWEDVSRIPTFNELEAPGLWLARIDLPE